MKLGELKYNLGVLRGFDLGGGVDAHHGCTDKGAGWEMMQGEERPTAYIPLRSCSRFGTWRGNRIRYIISTVISFRLSAQLSVIIISLNRAPPPWESYVSRSPEHPNRISPPYPAFSLL